MFIKKTFIYLLPPALVEVESNTIKKEQSNILSNTESQLYMSLWFVLLCSVYELKVFSIFGAYSWVHFFFLICLVLDQKLLLMRIPAAELSQSLPLAYYGTTVAGLCVFQA